MVQGLAGNRPPAEPSVTLMRLATKIDNRFTAWSVSAADDAARTLTAMLELARLDNDRPVIRREPLRLDALVETAVSNLGEQASTADVSLTADAGVNVVIDGDEHLLTLAVTALIENAIRHGG